MLWTYDDAERLRALAGRCEALATFLYREACDAPAGPRRAALDARRAVVLARRRRLLECARALRRDRRLACAR